MASDTLPVLKNRVREKIRLNPGFHLIDWMRLSNVSDFSCRNGGPMRLIPTTELRQHKSKFDCWTAYKGKVYNITQYLPYHPGGEKILMSGAGKDCTALFEKYHKWVNIDTILAKCVVGKYMSENEIILEGVESDENEVTEVLQNMKISSYPNNVEEQNSRSSNSVIVSSVTDCTRSSIDNNILAFQLKPDSAAKPDVLALLMDSDSDGEENPAAK